MKKQTVFGLALEGDTADMLDAATPQPIEQQENVIATETIDTSTLASGWEETLIVLITEGPLDDGDIPSKSARDSLIDAGCATKIIIKGEEAGNAATYKGRALFCQLTETDCLKDGLEKIASQPEAAEDDEKKTQQPD